MERFGEVIRRMDEAKKRELVPTISSVNQMSISGAGCVAEFRARHAAAAQGLGDDRSEKCQTKI
jgi:hypothetical protein